MIFMFEAGRRARWGFLSYTGSPVSRRMMRTEKTTLWRPVLARMPSIRLARSKDAGAAAAAAEAETTVPAALVSSAEMDEKVEAGERPGAEAGNGLRKNMMARKSPGTPLFFFILSVCASLTLSNSIP
jgi:hypothetical protein